MYLWFLHTGINPLAMIGKSDDLLDDLFRSRFTYWYISTILLIIGFTEHCTLNRITQNGTLHWNGLDHHSLHTQSICATERSRERTAKLARQHESEKLKALRISSPVVVSVVVSPNALNFWSRVESGLEAWIQVWWIPEVVPMST